MSFLGSPGVKVYNTGHLQLYSILKCTLYSSTYSTKMYSCTAILMCLSVQHYTPLYTVHCTLYSCTAMYCYCTTMLMYLCVQHCSPMATNVSRVCSYSSHMAVYRYLQEVFLHGKRRLKCKISLRTST